MDVILLERIGRLGKMGETVRVRDGYARNFLLPQGKALRANESNKARFEREREQLEKRNQELKNSAEAVAANLADKTFIMVRQAGETGQLYGSVSSRDIAEILNSNDFKIAHTQVKLDTPLKTIGIHTIVVALHPEVDINIGINIARSQQEAERQAEGEDLTQRAAEPKFETFVPEEGDEEA